MLHYSLPINCHELTDAVITPVKIDPETTLFSCRKLKFYSQKKICLAFLNNRQRRNVVLATLIFEWQPLFV